MENTDAKRLLIKYKEGTCTAKELALLESWYLEYKEDQKGELTVEELDAARSKVWARLPVHYVRKPIKLWPVMTAVASIIVLVAAGIFFYKNNKEELPLSTPQITKIVPGGNKAILTLADGTKISLTDAKSGQLASQAGLKVSKASDGQLVYTVSENEAGSGTESVGYNTVTTPRGGNYRVNLPDGTKVWLNAASSLTFPTAFVDAERKVQLTGEGYFEVAHDAGKPFKVASGTHIVEVLGTHFNVNAYQDDDQIRTTLLQGKVKVKKGAEEVLLRPDEQAVFNGSALSKQVVNAQDEVAWTENEFVFNNENLGSIMRKISRWYDVDVVCPPEISEMEFTGTISRKRNIKDVLNLMDRTETVHFKFEGRRITVMR